MNRKFSHTIFKRVSFVLAGLIAAFAIERGTHAATDGFTLLRINSDLPYNEKYAPPRLEENEKAQLKEILNQRFHYLACGSQSFVFKSSDNRYILKFFKHHRFKTPFVFRAFPLPKTLDTKRTLRIAKKLETLHETFSSCQFSYDTFKTETGLLYPHLTKTKDLNLKATLVDRLGIEHIIDLDNVEFLLQKKADSTPEYFSKLRNSQGHDEAKAAFDQLLELAERRCLMGYVDKDPHLIRNFGFIDDQAVEFDVGGFVPFAQPNPRRFYTKDIRKIKLKALPWFQKNYPEIADYVLDQMNSLTEESSDS